MNWISVDKKDVPVEWQTLFGYKGRTFTAIVHEDAQTTISDNDLRWSGGSVKGFLLVEDGKTRPLTTVSQWPDSGSQRIDLRTAILVEHCIFCGKDMGLTFHVGPDSLNPFRIEHKQELTDDQKAVLWVACSRKSSYNGMNRHDMLNEARRWNKEEEMPRSVYDETVEQLKSKGLLDKRGAATTEGKNTYQNFRNIYM